MESNRDERRQVAQFLVIAILDWGGQGKDVAAFLGVSATTVSHWRGVKSGQNRKPAVPSDEQIEKLIAILRFRIQQNLGFLTVLIHSGGFDRRTSALIAKSYCEEAEKPGAYFRDFLSASGPGFDEMIENFREVQDTGGAASLRTLLNPIVVWGSETPDLNSIPDINEPCDLDKIREQLTVGPELEKRVECYVAEFRDMLQERALKQMGMTGILKARLKNTT